MAKEIIVLIFLLLTVPIGADQIKVVNIVTERDYEPFVFTDKNLNVDTVVAPGQDAQTLKGYGWDIVRHSYHEMGYTIHVKTTPWARSLYLVENRKFDVLFPASKSPSRLMKFQYSKRAINKVKVSIYVRADDLIKWKDLSSLKGRLIAAKRQFNYGQQWNAATFIAKYPVDSIEQGFQMLVNKRVDGFIGYNDIWDHTIKKMGKESQVKKLPVFDEWNEHLLGAKGNEKATVALQAFDKGFEKIKKNGTLEKIKKKWFGK